MANRQFIAVFLLVTVVILAILSLPEVPSMLMLAVLCGIGGFYIRTSAVQSQSNWIGVVKTRIRARALPRWLLLWQLHSVRSRSFVNQQRACGLFMMLMCVLINLGAVLKMTGVLPAGKVPLF